MNAYALSTPRLKNTCDYSQQPEASQRNLCTVRSGSRLVLAGDAGYGDLFAYCQEAIFSAPAKPGALPLGRLLLRLEWESFVLGAAW